MLMVIQSFWFKRWRVYRIGHLDGDEIWVASFRHKEDAFRFVNITE